MKYEFHWLSNIPENAKRSAQEAIREGQACGQSPISFCHDGAVVVTLRSSDALQKRFAGEMNCSCGERRGTIKGKCDGSSLTFEASTR
ncbi:MAG: hypothetical protein PHY45_12635 [Rhodocyclaceae bacterium]|nr:hypothetical protein [Rhodocyclaceae bacterium]